VSTLQTAANCSKSMTKVCCGWPRLDRCRRCKPQQPAAKVWPSMAKGWLRLATVGHILMLQTAAVTDVAATRRKSMAKSDQGWLRLAAVGHVSTLQTAANCSKSMAKYGQRLAAVGHGWTHFDVANRSRHGRRSKPQKKYGKGWLRLATVGPVSTLQSAANRCKSQQKVCAHVVRGGLRECCRHGRRSRHRYRSRH
jgi:hypothetical protein